MAMHSPSRSDRAKLRQIRRAPRAVGGAANFRAEMARGYPPHIQKAFDELRFGPLRTLNLRDGLPSADEARDRADRWIRTKQVERAGELLVITGRGNNSENGVGRIRQSVLALLPSLRRRNVITGWEEHTPARSWSHSHRCKGCSKHRGAGASKSPRPSRHRHSRRYRPRPSAFYAIWP